MALNASISSWFTWDCAQRHATTSTLYEKAETSQWKAADVTADLALPRAGGWVLGWMDGAHSKRRIGSRRSAPCRSHKQQLP
jgi:hypothetical protein